MTWQLPWVTSGIDELPVDVARSFAYAATDGQEGVIGDNALEIAATGTPSANITTAAGIAIMRSRFVSSINESYIGRNTGSVTTAVPATSGSARSDLVYAHVIDPGQAGQPPDAAPMETRVIVGVPDTTIELSTVSGYENQTGLALARIDRPSGTATVENSHIVDLRSPLSSKTSPVGAMTMYPAVSGSLPAGWLLCDGSAVSRTDYPDLFALIGTDYGVGDGAITFNVPDMRDVFPLGASGTYALGDTGGAATHTLVAAEMPQHSHFGSTGSVADHTHSETNREASGSTIQTTGGAGTVADDVYEGGTTGAAGGHSHTIPISGGDEPHNNMPPYRALNFIIRGR